MKVDVYPFAHHIPSVFLVGSPFQCLCAEAAIKNLEIDDYRIIAIFTGNSRDRQLDNFINQSLYKYEKFELTRYNLLIEVINVCLGKKGKYERMFLGNFTSTFLLSIGMANTKNNSVVVYIDDGNSVVSLFQNSFKGWDKKRNTFIYYTLAKLRGIQVMKNFYTIYSDIENEHFNIEANDLKAVILSKERTRTEGVYFIGTNIKSFCSQMNLKEQEYINQIKRAFQHIRCNYPNDRLIYIPHGSDPSDYAKDICSEYCAEFVQVDLMVECFIADSDSIPVAIYGLCSTSLLNIKRMLPRIDIRNIFVHKDDNNPFVEKYRSISNYYETNNIPTIEWVV